MSATAYDVSYPAYSRSFQPSLAASHLSPLFDVSPLLYPPTPLRDVSSSSSTFFPNDATQQPQRFSAVAQHVHSEQFSSSGSSSTSSSSTSQQTTGTFLSSLSTSAPHSPLSIHHPPHSSASYFDYTETVTHTASNARSQQDALSFTHQQQLLHHRILQQQLQAKAAVAVPASPVSVQSDTNSVSGGSAQDLFPTSDSVSSHSSQSPQQLSSVSSMSTPPPLQSSAIPLPNLHSYSHSHSVAQPQTDAAGQPSVVVDGKKRKGALSRKIACNVCHLAKTSCDGARPCSRCVRLLKTSQCVDRPSKIAKNRVNAAPGSTVADETSAAAPTATTAATTAAVAPAPSAIYPSSTLHSSPVSSSRPAVDQPFVSSDQSRRPLSAVVEDVDVDDEHNDSDRSLPHSHSGEEWCEAASDHSFSSADDDSDSVDSVHSPYSLSFEAHISRSLLRAHVNWMNKQTDNSTNPTQRMDLREKLLYFSWIRHMMLAEDLEQIIHYSEVYHRGEHLLSPHGCSPPPDRRPVTPPSYRRRHKPYTPCDGTVCNNFCPTARTWAASNPVVFTWHSSPVTAIVDSTHGSHAVLVCRNLQDPLEVEQQRKKIVANTLVLREREKQRQRLARGVTETTVHISPVVDDCAGGAAAASPAPQRPSSSDGSVQFDDVEGIDTIINMCGVSPLEMSQLQAAREEQREEASMKQSLTTLAVRHADCPALTDLLPSVSSSSSPSVPLPASPPIEMALSVHVNPPFERLFGYSQAELRQHFIRDGGKALYYLTRRDDWEKLMELDQEATWGREQEYRTYACIVNKCQSAHPTHTAQVHTRLRSLT